MFGQYLSRISHSPVIQTQRFFICADNLWPSRMNYEVLEGKGPLFESVFNKVLGVMQGMDGHKASHLFRDVNSPNRYLIISEWTRRDAFDAFIKSDRFKGVVTWGKEQVLAGRPKHEVYGQDEPSAGSSPAKGGCPVQHD